MKTTGIVRQMDSLGRIVLPIELRRTLNIEQRDSLEIYVEGDKIVLKKYTQACSFCGSTKNLVDHKGKNICASCIEELKKL